MCPNVNPWISRPAGSPFGSCRIGAGLSSQTAAFRPLSTSRRSGASRARRRTPEEPRHTPGSGYRPRRTVGPPRRRIRPVGSHCGNLGPPPQHLVSIKARCGVGAGFVVACCAVSDMTTGLVTIQIGCCPSLDAMNTGQAALTWPSAVGMGWIRAAIGSRIASPQGDGEELGAGRAGLGAGQLPAGALQDRRRDPTDSRRVGDGVDFYDPARRRHHKPHDHERPVAHDHYRAHRPVD